MLQVIPSAIRPLSDPTGAPLGLVVRDDGVIVVNIGDGAGVEVALTPRDALIVGGQLVKYAIRLAALSETPAAGQG